MCVGFDWKEKTTYTCLFLTVQAANRSYWCTKKILSRMNVARILIFWLSCFFCICYSHPADHTHSLNNNNWFNNATACSAVLCCAKEAPAEETCSKTNKSAYPKLSEPITEVSIQKTYCIPAGNFTSRNACLSASGRWHWNWIICKVSQVENNDFDSPNRHCGAHLHFFPKK